MINECLSATTSPVQLLYDYYLFYLCSHHAYTFDENVSRLFIEYQYFVSDFMEEYWDYYEYY
jgi:hypothetical protein